MTNKEPGYVYILTNPSFREDWVKIGKSGHPRRGGEVSGSENRPVIRVTVCLSSALREYAPQEYYDRHFGCIAGRKTNLPIEHLPARDFLAYHRKKVFVGV